MRRATLIGSAVAGALVVSTIGVASALSLGDEPDDRARPAQTNDTGQPTRGRIPDDAVDADGYLDLDKVPDYVPALGRDGATVGWMRKADALPSTSNEPAPVFGDDLRTLVGHMYPARGFVPLGTDPGSVPAIEVEIEVD